MIDSFAKRVQVLKRRPLLALLVLASLLLAGSAIYFGGRHLSAWHHYREAQVALGRRNLVQARAHLLLCLEGWPTSVPTYLLLARTARLAGAYEEAERHLQTCDQLHGAAEDIRLERSLLNAQRGELPSLQVQMANPGMVEISLRDPPAEMAGVRDYLLSCVANGHPETPLILEALAHGYLQNERTVSALHCVEQLLQCRPDHVQALVWHGKLKDYYGEPDVALADYRRAVDLDPEQDEARLHLAESLLQFRKPEEAQAHFEKVRQRQSGNPRALLGLARCQRALGQLEEARQLLEELLGLHPQHVGGLLERARLALAAGEAADAERWLRDAVAREPYNHQVNYSLHQCLQERGKHKEARQFLNRAEHIASDWRRVDEISKQIAKTPRDPSLRYEVGLILLRNGQEQKGLTWLASALQEDPKHQPSHQVLADYYERAGKSRLAAAHRQLGQQGRSDTPAVSSPPPTMP